MYRNSSNAWLTTELFNEWLHAVNSKMKRQNRRILLLLDNAPVHICEIDLSNVKLQFLPPNMTFHIQPLDAGIIQSFKLHYRKLMLEYFSIRMETAACVTELVKSINILDAVKWISSAWGSVAPSTIEHCFAKCGVEILQTLESNIKELEFHALSRLGGTDYAIIRNDVSIPFNNPADDALSFVRMLVDEYNSPIEDDEVEEFNDIDAVEVRALAPVSFPEANEMLERISSSFPSTSAAVSELVLQLRSAHVERMRNRKTSQTSITSFFQ